MVPRTVELLNRLGRAMAEALFVAEELASTSALIRLCEEIENGMALDSVPGIVFEEIAKAIEPLVDADERTVMCGAQIAMRQLLTSGVVRIGEDVAPCD